VHADCISHSLKPELKYDSALIDFKDLVLDCMVEVSYSSLMKERKFAAIPFNDPVACKGAPVHKAALRAGATLSVAKAQCDRKCCCQGVGKL
jgi:hypothetical protein